jgi:hypothetical protein
MAPADFGDRRLPGAHAAPDDGPEFAKRGEYVP